MSDDKKRALVGAAILVLAGWGVYANSLGGPLLFDDLWSVGRDESLRSFSTVFDTAPGSGANGRPVVALSLALNHALGGLDVRGYHALNVTFHVLTALVLFGLVRRTYGFVVGDAPSSTVTAFAVALLWVVHPLTTDALNQIISRNEILMALFYLLALYAVARGLGSSRPAPWFALCVAAAVASVGSKENGVSVCLAILIYDRTFVAETFGEALRRRRGLYAGLLLPIAFVTWLSATSERGFGEALATPLEYALAQPEAILLYLKLAFWPSPLVVDYGNWLSWEAAGGVGWQLAGVALLAGATLWALLRGRVAGFLGFVFFAVLAPTSSFIPISGEIAAEHRMYLPLAAVIALVVIGVERAVQMRGAAFSAKARPVLCAVVLLASVMLGWHTVQRNRDYADLVTIWQDALDKRPGNQRAALYLADERARVGDGARAVEAYKHYLRLRPDHVSAHMRLADLLESLGRRGEAQQHRLLARQAMQRQR
ncbi:MAG: hypothetical protein GY716_07700 [bacterium]|nr:hypothetical protein [bacterium]